VKYWEIIANNLKKAGWSLGYVSAVDSRERTIWIADAHRGDGKRLVVRGDEKLRAFLELESAICACTELPRQAGQIFPQFSDMKTRIPPILMTFALVCFALVENTQAVSPPPDGGYPGGNTAEGQAALLSLTTGGFNTAVGFLSLRSDTTHSFNTAVGAGALLANNADSNTATGVAALFSNTTGNENVAEGPFALFMNTTGSFNTAGGFETLFSNLTGQFNTAYGFGALDLNTVGDSNTAIGTSALEANTTGNNNTAIGDLALSSSTTGSSNIAVGVNAATNVITASNVICIGNVPGADVSNTCFIGSIRGATTINNNAIPVLIDGFGQLGTASSSRRFKTDIKTIDKASESILGLKPVSFRYKVHKDTTPQFGLIAEEVAQVNPDLVIYDADGRPYTVRYEAVNAMLLNEFLKEHRTVQEQGATIAQLKSTVGKQEAAAVKQEAIVAQQQKQIEALVAGLQKVSDQLEAGKPSPRVVNNP
jgi:hypothetical protein